MSLEKGALDIIHDKNSKSNGTFLDVSTVDEEGGPRNETSSFSHTKTTKDGKIILLPQPSANPADPLNWSWSKKHSVLLALLLPSLLTDWGMTYGTTLFEEQAVEFHMAVPAAAASVSGGIFMQGPGGIFCVPLVQRYGRLPVLFWSQFLALLTIIGATFAPTYAGFTALRTLQGLFGTAPQVIGLTMIHDMFFFHEHASKINIWAFCFVIGPYVGPMISSFLLEKLYWRADMGILAAFYGFSTLLVIFLGEETMFNRHSSMSPTVGSSKVSVLIGLAGARAEGQTKVMTVVKNLAEISWRPQLLLPSLYIMVLFTWAIGIVTTITQFIRPPPYLLDDTSVSLFYFAPIIGSILAEFWGHWFNDFLFNRYVKTHQGVHQPENRLWAVYLGAVFSFVSLILYGQTLQKELPVVGLAFSWAIMAFAQVVVVSAISAYVLDCFPEHAALASSWVNFWRTTGGFCVTYFQTQWVARDGAAATFGIQAGIVGAAVVFVIASQLCGRSWRFKFAPPSPGN